MALTFLVLSAFLFYLTSKYFPSGEDLGYTIKKTKIEISAVATLLLLASLWLFSRSYEFSTAFMIWLAAVMTIMSALIITVSLHLKWLYVWALLCALFTIIEFI